MSEENVDVGSETSTEISPEVEREAKLLGWVPKEQYRGNPDEWRDANEFLDFGKKLNPILRKNNENLLKRLETREKELDEIRATVKDFAKFHKETEERAYKRALEDLKQQKKTALEEGDYDAAVELDDQIADIKAAAKETPKAKEPEDTSKEQERIYKDWESANSWAKDPEIAKKAQVVGYELRLNGDTSVGRDFLDNVAEAMKEKHPEVFGNVNRDRGALVEGSAPAGNTGSGKKGKSYNDLPSDAKKECDKFVAQGLLTKEQYVKDYFEG